MTFPSYGQVLQDWGDLGRAYPVGLLGGDVEIYFKHYHDADEVRETWARRKARITWHADDLLVKFDDRDRFTKALLHEFDTLPYRHQVCFTAARYPNSRSAVWIRACRHLPCVPTADVLFPLIKRSFDLAAWLNGGSGRIGPLKRFWARLFW